MLDKNPEEIIDDDLKLIKNQFEKNVPNIVVCSEPFNKAEFLIRLINSTNSPIIFIDLDYLHSGYVESGMIQKKKDLTILRLEKDNWKENLTEIITKASKEKFLIIVDSLNGIYNMFDNLDSARFINSCLILLASIGKQAKSSVIITAMVRKKESGELVLSPGGKQLVKSAQTNMFYVTKTEKQLILSELGKNNSRKFMIRRELSSHLLEHDL